MTKPKNKLLQKQDRKVALALAGTKLKEELDGINAELAKLGQEETIKDYAQKFGLKAALDEFSLEQVATAFELKP